jgi:hypothetical protein
VTSAPAATRGLSFKVPHQERSEWCWVAVSLGVDRFFRPDSTHCQCEIAGSALNLKCCNGTQPADSHSAKAADARPEASKEITDSSRGAVGTAAVLRGSSDTCNTPHAIHPVLGTYHLLAADPITKPLTFEALRSEIDAGRPVCVLIKWLDSQGQVTQRGHFIAINGYRVTSAQKEFVSITDPMYGESEVAFEQFSSAHGGYRDGRGVWFASFLVANMKAS